MTKNEYIPITETPYVSKLAKDYLLGKDIGINNPFVKDYKGIFDKADSKHFSNENRNLLVEALFNQYEKDGVVLDKDSNVYQNIQSLKKSNTFTFTTGQQIHIFLGPLFFIYKIQSLFRHVKNFNALNNGVKVVPVFWMASEDHDLDEINFVKLYGEKYTWEEESGNAVGRLICKGLPELIDKIEARADKTEENKELFTLFRKHYSKEKTLAAATRSLLNEIFGEEGLLIIDPDDKTFKQGFSEIAKKEIQENILFNSYNDQNILLKKSGYEPRVNAQEINFFWLENDNRVKLKVKNNKIVIGDSDEELSLDNIIKNIDKLSPNVITRPLYQETILPNILYLGGGAELEYWLPLQEAFKNLGLQYPALVQRDSVLYISKKNFDSFDKIGLKWWELFQEEKKLVAFYNNFLKDDSNNPDQIIDSINLSIEQLSETLKIKEIKSGLIFKEISEMQKGLSRLSKQLFEEELKIKAKDPVFSRIIKIKEKLFDKKQEREEFLVGSYLVLKHSTLEFEYLKPVINFYLIE